MKKIYFWSLLNFVMVAMLSMGFASCGGDDDSSESQIIPSGTYIEENGHEYELFTMVVNGNNIKISITKYGKEWKNYQGTYIISGNSITITLSDGTKETNYFKMEGKRVTIGEITYIKQ